jgi:hypothetical protein
MLDMALATVVTVFAERLQRREPEQVPIAVVTVDMIDLSRDDSETTSIATTAPGFDVQLMLSTLAPAVKAVPRIPMRMTTVA